MKPRTQQPISRGGKSNQGARLKTEMPATAEVPFPTERLASFRLPRDLTLGGRGLSATRGSAQRAAAANKKVYTPNLNAVRNKNLDVKTSRDTTINARGRPRGGGNRADRGSRGRGGSNNSRGSLVTSAGLFSEGAGDGTTKRMMSSRLRASNDNTDVTQLRRPTIIKKEKVDPIVEQKHMRDIYELDNEPMDEDKSDDGLSPINLSQIKSEPNLENRLNGLEIKTEQETHTTMHEYPATLEEFFQRTGSQMFMLQLPDVLPGHGPIQEPAESAEFERPESPDPTSMFCTMGQIEEGVIGRLVRYKSGKTRLILGETRFDIELGMDPGFLQEVISLNTNSNERSGNIINLGQIGAKLSAIPDWDYMFTTPANASYS